ncbi:MAG: hypothetical protein RR902_05450 [Oscillospiraceae bacterium]
MDYKHGGRAIQNLMLIISAGMLIVLVGGMVNPQVYNYLTLDRGAILHGQVWRLFTFIFMPPMGSGLFFTLIGIYFYYFIGSSLEGAWGAFRFNVYYLCGVVALIISAMITGYADAYFLNMSLFFAFAALFPEQQVLLFFVIPIKIKWLAWLDAALFVFQFIFGNWVTRGSILAVLIVFVIFFWEDIINAFKNFQNYLKMRKQRNNYNNGGNNRINFR